MAEVYRAEDTLLERTVAVKLLRGQLLSDPEFVARFQQEARSAAKVAHPNIVGVYDVGAVGQTNYIVMEFVEGESLKELIRREGPLSVGQTVDIGSQILAALSYAHQKGLVHRDVKPQNILVGGDGQIKVADFGIARAADDPQHTAAGVVLATAQYCSPEQASGKPASAAADIYAAGVVLYEMLTGRLPFEADSALAVALMHLQEAPRPPSELNPSVPPRLEQIVLRAMAKEPEMRFASAGEMRQALQSYQSFGQEQTTVFRAIPAAAPAVRAGAGAAALAVGRPAGSRQPLPAGTRPAAVRDPRHATRGARRRGGIDWLAIAVGVFVFAAVASAVPLGLRLWTLYSERAVPTAPSSPTSPTAPTQPAGAVKPGASTATSPTPPAGSGAIAPRFIGLTFEQAERVAAEAKLSVVVAGESFSSHPPSIVLSQAPTPDTPLPPGSTINLIVSKGPEQAVVSPVVGDTFEEAKRKLELLGFLLDPTEESDQRVEAGRVIAQWPEGGQLAPKGSIVMLTVSRGSQQPTATPSPTPAPSPTSRPMPTPTPSNAVRPPEGDFAWVPDLVKLPEAEARRRVDLAGLHNGFTNYQTEADVAPAMRDFFRSVAPGSVLSISPNVGERVQRGTTVHIAVKKP